MKDSQIALGMYSLDKIREGAWHALFLLAGNLSPQLKLPRQFVNSVDESIVLDDKTCISHVCGYPLIDKYANCLEPLCAPQFGLTGISGPQYFSYYVSHRDSAIKSVEHARGKILAANSRCSQSGFNVWRHELGQRDSGVDVEDFFGKVVFTGSHQQSIESIINGDCDVSAIDAVSYDYLSAIYPHYSDMLRVIGVSCHQAAPPLVAKKGNPICSPQGLTEALNKALDALDGETKQILNIQKFHPVDLDDYRSQLLA